MRFRVLVLGLIASLLPALVWFLPVLPAHAADPQRLATPFGSERLAATQPYTGYLPIVAREQQLPEEQLLALIKDERARQGLAPLTLNPILMQVALAHSQDMRDRNFFGHVNPDDLRACQRLTNAGYDWWACGENIGAGYASVQAVFNAWMSSAGHRANILDPDFTEIGFGYAAGGDYGHYWTLDLGRPF